MAVDLFHHHQGNVFVRDAVDECVLQYVREGAVPDIVHEDGSLDCFGLRFEDEDAFLLQGEYRLAHEVEGT